MKRRAVYGNRLAAFAQIYMELADGSKSPFITNEDWVAGTDRIAESDPVDGERIDLNISDDDWTTTSEPPSRFTTAYILLPSTRKLVAEEVNRVKEVERLPAKRIPFSPSGSRLSISAKISLVTCAFI